MFRAYLKEGRDIGDTEVLSDIADAAGMDAAMIRQLMQSDADAQDVRDRDAWAREKGVSGVPTFVVGQQHAVPGAQPPELWAKVISELVVEEAEE